MGAKRSELLSKKREKKQINFVSGKTSGNLRNPNNICLNCRITSNLAGEELLQLTRQRRCVVYHELRTITFGF